MHVSFCRSVMFRGDDRMAEEGDDGCAIAPLGVIAITVFDRGLLLLVISVEEEGERKSVHSSR